MRRERLISRIIKRLGLLRVDTIPARSIDIIGDIAILKMPNELREAKFRLAEILLREVPSIRVVYRQTSPVAGDFRLRGIEWLGGEKRSTTIYTEHGCRIEVDLEKDYFSQRLAHERSMIAEQVKASETSRSAGEVIVNMFAGVGSFSLRIARETGSSKVFSVDMNPDAFQRMFRNVLLNKMLGRIVSVYGEAALVIENVLKRKADRVLMPLPEKSLEYLKSALTALKPAGGMVNYESFTYAGKGINPIDVSRTRLHSSLGNLGCKYSIKSERVIRSVGPGWYQVAHDIQVTFV
jgi:tRNA (guanine37-N1)-methyltransferase